MQSFQLDFRDGNFSHTSRGADGPDGTVVSLPVAPRVSEPVLFIVRDDGTKTQGWLTGEEAAQTTPVPQGYFDRFRLGRNRVGGQYFKGDIGEILVYFRALADLERQQTEQELMVKWGFVVSNIAETGKTLQGLRLEQNYPNPFNSSTAIRYHLPEAGDVRLEVFDMEGRSVAILVDERQAPGSYQAIFNAENLFGGMYIYRLNAAGRVLTRKMAISK